VTSAFGLSIVLLVLGAISLLVLVTLLTLVAIAFLGTPDDLNDVDIDGKPKRDKK
jgi:hypothetical protein